MSFGASNQNSFENVKIPWKGELREGVRCKMADWGVGEEFHDHADVLGGGVEHHWREVHCGTEREIILENLFITHVG